MLAYLVVKTNQPSFDYEGAVRAMRELKQLDARWRADTLALTVGLSNNFDAVAAPLPAIATHRRTLEAIVAGYIRDFPDKDHSIGPLLESEQRAISDMTVLIERIKSQHAILANSSRFLPIASQELLATTPDTVAASRLDKRLNRLLADTMSYVLTPDGVLESRLRQQNADLRDLVGELPEAARDKLNTLLAHADILVTKRREGAQLLTQLAAVPSEKTINELNDAFVALHGQALAEQQVYRQLLLAYATLLLALLGYACWVVYRSYQEIRDKNRSLTSANAETQMMLIQSAKMSAIGQMVAGIAHEINTPLAYVKATFSVLSEQMTQLDRPVDERQMQSLLAEEVRSLLEDGRHGIEQISKLVMTLKNFSRIDKAKRGDFSVQDGLDGALEIARYMLKYKVSIEKRYSKVPRIKCAPSQINQVFLNILMNAVQAMPNRPEMGVITLRIGMHDVHTVRVDIQDDGTGIPDDVLPRIFDPFFTTKKLGEGTGAGLAICYRIVENHGGRILVDTAVGVGTTFSVLLPVQEHEPRISDSLDVDLSTEVSPTPESAFAT